MNFVIIGKIVDTFGIKGYLKVNPFSDKEIFKKVRNIFLKKRGGDYVKFELEDVSDKGNFLTIKLKGYDSPEEALIFKGAHIYLPEEELPSLAEDEFYYYQLVDIEVKDEKGEVIGKVKAIHDMGVYNLIELSDGKTFIPFVSDIVKKVDVKNKEIIVDRNRIFIPSS